MSQGRTLSWESLENDNVPAILTAQFPNLAFLVGTFDVRYSVLVPVAVTRGAVTVERIRGEIRMYHEKAQISANIESWPILLMLQLTPVRDGVIVNEAVLDPANSADLESNRIMWRQGYYPQGGSDITQGTNLYHTDQECCPQIDIKSKRRFERSTWALIMTCRCLTISNDDHLCAQDLRALIRSADAV